MRGRTTIVYYSLRLVISGTAPVKLINQQERSELFLSANGALVGMSKPAHLESKELAEQFREAYLPRLVKRYGDSVTVEIIRFESIGNDKRLAAKIAADSLLARKRIETGVLASNIKP
jgi:hypothetical protein